MRIFRTVKATADLNKGAILEANSTGYMATSGIKKVCADDHVWFSKNVVEQQPQWFEEVFPVYKSKREMK